MQNELALYDGKIGFLDEEGDPQTFLSIESYEKVYFEEPAGELKDYPTYEFKFVMGNKKAYYTREAYTFFELLGDFGGFNDSILMIVGLLTSFYGSQMYQAAIAKEIKY